MVSESSLETFGPLLDAGLRGLLVGYLQRNPLRAESQEQLAKTSVVEAAISLEIFLHDETNLLTWMQGD